jgi:hypothetical protein
MVSIRLSVGVRQFTALPFQSGYSRLPTGRLIPAGRFLLGKVGQGRRVAKQIHVDFACRAGFPQPPQTRPRGGASRRNPSHSGPSASTSRRPSLSDQLHFALGVHAHDLAVRLFAQGWPTIARPCSDYVRYRRRQGCRNRGPNPGVCPWGGNDRLPSPWMRSARASRRRR